MPVTAIIGAGFGSEGKGAFASAVASKFDAAVRTGGPNAGHSLQYEGRVYKMRSVPCAWVNPDATLIIGAGAVVKRDLLLRELQDLPRRVGVLLDSNAVIVTHEMEQAEQEMIGKIGSTAEGVGQARIARIRRKNGEPVLARDYSWPESVQLRDTALVLAGMLRGEEHVMLEGTQGSGLSVFSPAWPFVTSGDTNVQGFLSEAQIAPSHLGHTILVARSYPIRVGGNSGPLKGELSWADVPGSPTPEVTTVTQRQRRIGIWDEELFARAVAINDPCGIVLSFLDYVDPSIAGTPYLADVAGSSDARDFINKIERSEDVPVIAVGTGGPTWQYVGTEVCKHGERWLA